MDWTDRHCRRLHRTLSRRARLYTEMLTADAVIHGDRAPAARLRSGRASGGAAAGRLGAGQARRGGADRRGRSATTRSTSTSAARPTACRAARFGACLMAEPALVAACMAAIRAAVAIPATVKCRLGVDEQDPDEALFALVDACAAVGVTVFVVHARKAWLKGLSPKENREIPPLDYPLVWRLKRERPAPDRRHQRRDRQPRRSRGAPGARRRRDAGPRRLPRALAARAKRTGGCSAKAPTRRPRPPSSATCPTSAPSWRAARISPP